MGTSLILADVHLVADATGALWWPDQRLLAFADLHLEKGSAYAARGRFLPPYDSAATLERMIQAIRRYRPATILCLGDSFHDRQAATRLDPPVREGLGRLVSATDWWWIAGNHDPAPPAGLGGRTAPRIAIGGVQFQHEADDAGGPTVAGHLHPVAAVRTPARRVRSRCFAVGAGRLILPAFGAYTGGLNVLEPSFSAILGPRFEVYLTARDRVRHIPRSALAPD